jgi:hypothetical protein
VQPLPEPTADALCLSAQRWSPALRRHAKCGTIKRGEYMQRLALDVIVMDEASLEDVTPEPSTGSEQVTLVGVTSGT